MNWVSGCVVTADGRFDSEESEISATGVYFPLVLKRSEGCRFSSGRKARWERGCRRNVEP